MFLLGATKGLLCYSIRAGYTMVPGWLNSTSVLWSEASGVHHGHAFGAVVWVAG